MPLYNKAPYVAKAVRSVLSQTFRDFELIVMDDGSTDNSFDVTHEAIKDAGVPVSLLCEDNAGVGRARNNAVAASRGDYLCFLDADDWWEPAFLERMDAFIRDYPEAGLFGTNYYYVMNGKVRIGVTKVRTGYINYCKAYADNVGMPIWTGAVSLPRTVFDEMGGFSETLSLGEDFRMWLGISFRYKTAFLNEPLASYYQDSDPEWRAVGHLVSPESHMLWHLDDYAEKEASDPEYKRLIDALRTYVLMPYYLSRQYRDAARQELSKVDWSVQPAGTRIRYSMPVFILKIYRAIMSGASMVKRVLVR